MKRRITPSRYRSILSPSSAFSLRSAAPGSGLRTEPDPDITGYRAALIDLGQTLALLEDVLKQARLSDAPVSSCGWTWPGMTLGAAVKVGLEARDVVSQSVEVVDRVTQGIEHAQILSEAASVLHNAAEVRNPEYAKIQMSEACHWSRIASLLGQIAQGKPAVARVSVTRARATLREAERMKKRVKIREREGGDAGG